MINAGRWLINSSVLGPFSPNNSRGTGRQKTMQKGLTDPFICYRKSCLTRLVQVFDWGRTWTGQCTKIRPSESLSRRQYEQNSREREKPKGLP